MTIDPTPIHVVMAISDVTGNYSKYAATTMVSLLLHTKKNVTFHILCDDTLSSNNKASLENTARKFNAVARFYEVSIPKELKGLKSLENITMGALFRLHIPRLLKGLDQVIYIDGDILVQCDISELAAYDIDGRYAGVVLDVETTRRNYIDTKLYRKLGVRYQNYFNSGVMILNIPLINEKMDLLSDGIALLRRAPYLKFADQDVLNILFSGNILKLPESFNRQIDLRDSADVVNRNMDSPVILHFSGRLKPWTCNHPEVIRSYYSYMVKTDFIRSVEELCEIMAPVSYDYSRKMDFIQNLLYTPYINVMGRVLCLLKSIFPGKGFQKAVSVIKYCYIRLIFLKISSR